MHQVYIYCRSFTVCLECETSKFHPDIRDSPVVLCRYEKTQTTFSFSNSEAQKYRTSSYACLHGKSATLECAPPPLKSFY